MTKKIMIVLLLGFSVLLATGCSPKPSLNEPQQRDDLKATAELGSITLNQKYVWSIVPLQQSDLSFKLPGRITSITVAEGDKVKKWDVIAAIESHELALAAGSNANMINALQQLKQATSEMFDAQILGMKFKTNQLELTKKSMELSGTNVGNTQLTTAELGHLTTIAEFDTTSNLLDQQEFLLYSNAQNAFSQAKIFLEPLGVFVDELFGISDDKDDFNDAFGIYLWAKDVDTLYKTRTLREQLNSKYQKLAPKLAELSQRKISQPLSEEEKSGIYQLLLETESFLIDTRELLRLVYKSLDKSIDDARVLPLSKLNELKQFTTIYQSNLEKILLSVEGNYTVGIKGVIDNINTFNKQSTIQRTLLGKKVGISEQQYNLTKEQLATQIAIIDEQYKEAIEWSKTLAKQKQAQLAQLESQIVQINGQSSQTYAQIEQTKLLAPYDGVIVKKFFEEGELVNPWYPVITIWSLWAKKVTIQVSDKDIAAIKEKEAVSIVIPSTEQYISGYVDIISPMANTLTRRRDVDIALTMKESDSLPLWSQANVFFTEHILTGIKIPEQSIWTLFGNTSITLFTNNGQLQQVPVQLIGCDQLYCIISGQVLAGDSIRLQ